MPPAPQTRRRRNSSRLNLIISMVFHTAIILALFIFAAREGLLGKQIKKIALEMAPKEKPPEKPKEKPPEPKVEPPKETPKPQELPKLAAVQPPPAATPPPAVAAPPVAAPPPASLGGFDFEGGKQVISTTNVVELYKSQVEFAFRSHWLRPDGMSDETFVAEVQVSIDPSGKVMGNEWKKGSGNPRWDDSVKKAVSQVKALSRPPPKGFPDHFVVRFDVQSDGEPVDALSLQ